MSESNSQNPAFEFHDKLRALIKDYENKSGTKVASILLSREEGQEADELQLQIGYVEE
ncbi:hypothetical protein LG201_04535 [Methylobacillus gramineus]|uniref:hypothetical protein n=1 Tax=Methylobacillus gramineus TaxID=755169 RepID=UPI001CFFDC4A|nr:hypothetical protein [Methylobacillus gramineus]MCB5184464.1 hypothetical protein [Methylobacillus gramineus]